ncbi:MAG TPA: redoxin domain-containing protein, partial [Planctomycetota bacterium]|nr:redoxin domain-containing protein [Planctomycetota bacterium]
LGRSAMNTRMNRLRGFSFLLAACWLAACAAPVAGAVDSLPEFSGEWCNSEPFEAADIKGKMIVLLFFDEGAPQYKTLWGDLAKVKQTHEVPDHVLFIAVNSGSPKGQVMAYCMTYHVTWKVLADENRAFEKQFGIRIDKNNFEQLYFVSPSGSVKSLDTTDAAKSVKNEVDANKNSVKWRMDPKDVPGTATPMWTSYELGAWKPLCGAVATNARSREPKLRECAMTINAALIKIIEEKTAAAKKLLDAGDKWGAFKAFRRIVASFPERPEAREAYDAGARLANIGSIDLEVRARLALDNTENSTRDIVNQPGAKAWYEAIVKNYPNTEAAATAQALIDDAVVSAGGTPGTAKLSSSTTGGAAGVQGTTNNANSAPVKDR